MSKRFISPESYYRGSAPASVLPCGTGPKHEDRRRLLRVAAFECDLEAIPQRLQDDERSTRQ